MKPFVDPPKPEDLSELSWHRLERSLFEVLDAEPAPREADARPVGRGRLVLAAGGFAFAAAAALALFALWPDSERASVTSHSISRLVTHESSSSITVGDASILADPHTALLVADNGASGVQVMLERGAIDCAVARRPGRAPFRILAGEVVVEVTGTVFRVERLGDSARVIVREGVVNVLAGGVLERVAHGEKWPAQAAALHPRTDAVTAAPAVAIAPEKAPSRADPKKAAPPVPAAKERYAAAAKLEASDPAAALAIYRRLAREGGSWAATALFAQGRLELERGEKARAGRTLERYLRKYPHGINASDARSLLLQLK